MGKPALDVSHVGMGSQFLCSSHFRFGLWSSAHSFFGVTYNFSVWQMSFAKYGLSELSEWSSQGLFFRYQASIGALMEGQWKAIGIDYIVSTLRYYCFNSNSTFTSPSPTPTTAISHRTNLMLGPRVPSKWPLQCCHAAATRCIKNSR